jgi:hypothetical protein
MPITTTAALLSYVLMLAAYFWHRWRWFHIPAMLALLAFDVSMPVYLYLHRHWWRRLIEHQQILTFGVMMHFALWIALYVLYALQIHTARRILKGDAAARVDHHGQGKAMLLVRALVIITGAILANPN